MSQCSAMTISQRGLDLIKRFEGFSAKPYLCPAQMMTIGYGHVIQPGELFTEVTHDEADALLRSDVAEAEDAIFRHVLVPLAQPQFDALVSLVFNIGEGAFARSTLLKTLNLGNYAGAAQQFDRWVYAKGKILKGLQTRRAAEKALFLEKTP